MKQDKKTLISTFLGYFICSFCIISLSDVWKKLICGRGFSEQELISMSAWLDFVGNLVISGVTSAAFSALTYRAFLHKLPDKVAQKMNEKLDPPNRDLQKDHERIMERQKYFADIQKNVREDVTKLVIQETINQEKYNNLKDDQKELVDSVHNLGIFAKAYQDMKSENDRLRQQVSVLTQMLQMLQSRDAQYQSPFPQQPPYSQQPQCPQQQPDVPDQRSHKSYGVEIENDMDM